MQGWPWAGIANLGVGSVPSTLTDKSSSLCLTCVLAPLSSWRPGVWDVPARGACRISPPMKTQALSL